MVLYFLLHRPLANNVMERAVCIELAGERKVDLSDVHSVSCLMNRKALRIRSITVHKRAKIASFDKKAERKSDPNEPFRFDETWGDSMARRKDGESIFESIERRKRIAVKDSQEMRKLYNIPSKITNTTKEKKPQGFWSRITRKSNNRQNSAQHFEEQSSASSMGASNLVYQQTGNNRNREEEVVEHQIVVVQHEQGVLLDDTDMDTDADTDAGTHDLVWAESEVHPNDATPSEQITSLPLVIHAPSRGQGALVPPDSSTSLSCSEAAIQELSLLQQRLQETKQTRVKHKLKSCLKVKTLEQSLQNSGRTMVHSSYGKCQDCLPQMPLRRPSNNDSIPRPPQRRGSMAEVSFSFNSSRTNQSQRDGDAFATGYRVNTIARHRLTWGFTEIREYRITLGDNPACSKGLPIQLDWRYRFLTRMPLVEYDESRHSSRSPRREISLKIPSHVRQHLLVNAGFTTKELTNAINAKKRDQKRRINTLSGLNKYKQSHEKRGNVSSILPTHLRHKRMVSTGGCGALV